MVCAEFEVLASSVGFMAASAFVSDESVLHIGIGVAQLRLVSLVQGDWLSGASQVAYQGGIDHLMRAGHLTICLARPGWHGPGAATGRSRVPAAQA